MEKKRIALRKLLEAVEKEILRKPDRKTLDHSHSKRLSTERPVLTRTINKSVKSV